MPNTAEMMSAFSTSLPPAVLHANLPICPESWPSPCGPRWSRLSRSLLSSAQECAKLQNKCTYKRMKEGMNSFSLYYSDLESLRALVS